MKLKPVQLGQQDGIEQMAICIRFFDSYGDDFKVREEFIGFVELEKLYAETISSAIIGYLIRV